MKVARIPALVCPACRGTRVHKNTAGSILCRDCGVKTTKAGRQIDIGREATAREMDDVPELGLVDGGGQRPRKMKRDGWMAVDTYLRVGDE